MPSSEKEKLSVILSKIKQIGIDSYESNISDNILNIFADLTLTEQRAFLKNLVTICFIIEDLVVDNSIAIINNKRDIMLNKENNQVNKNNIQNNKDNIQQVQTDLEAIKTELLDIDTINRLELIKLKSWFVKVTFIFILLAIIVFLGINIFIDGSSSVSSMLEDVFKIIKEILD